MALTEHDVERLRRAIALARNGYFAVEPNPPVGCVIEHAGGGILGESWHGAFGGPHAEIGALDLTGAAARGATVYVSLAPCGREGKTPPCADRLAEAGVARVVYAADDPDPRDDGAGLERLRAAGVVVEGPIAAVAAEAEALLVRFRRALSMERPWTVLKWAMSIDGCIAPAAGAGGRISGDRARLLTHDWRAHADAVAVGVGTVLADDPRLTCRLAGGLPHGRPPPRRVVIDAALRTPPDARLARDDGGTTWILTRADADDGRRAALEAAGFRLLDVETDGERVDLRAALRRLHADGIGRLLVEGGARIHGSLLRGGLADQVSVFVAPTILGGEDAVPAVRGTGFESMADATGLEDVQWRRLGADLLLQGYVPRG